MHRIGRTGRAGADGVAISLMDEAEQKMFESIKALTGSEIAVERIEGFEPRWWRNGDEPAAEVAVTTEPRVRSSSRNERPAREAGRSERTDKRSESRTAERSDAGSACGKIAGRSRRSRRERPKCALLQAGYGAQ